MTNIIEKNIIIRYLTTVLLLDKPHKVEELYSRLNEALDYFNEFKIEEVIPTIKDFRSYLQKYFEIDESEVVSVSLKNASLMKDMNYAIKEASKINLNFGRDDAKIIETALNHSNLSIETVFILDKELKEKRRFDPTNLEDLVSLFEFIMKKEESVNEIERLKHVTDEFHVSIDCFTERNARYYYLDYDYFFENNIFSIEKLADKKSEVIYFLLYCDLDYNLDVYRFFVSPFVDFMKDRILKFLKRNTNEETYSQLLPYFDLDFINLDEDLREKYSKEIQELTKDQDEYDEFINELIYMHLHDLVDKDDRLPAEDLVGAFGLELTNYIVLYALTTSDSFKYQYDENMFMSWELYFDLHLDRIYDVHDKKDEEPDTDEFYVKGGVKID